MELRIRIKLLIVLNLYQCVQNIVSREFLFHWEHGTYLYPHNKRERKKKDEKKSRKRAEKRKEQKREKRNEKREMRNEK
jgi:hypothetical protein